MKNRIYLNDGWKFSGSCIDEMMRNDFLDGSLEEVRIPHTFAETPLNCFDESIYQMVGVYRKRFFAEKNWQGKYIKLTFEGIAHESEVFLNGEKIGEHHCGYTAFSMDVSENLKYGEENLLVVKADSREDRNIPPFGHVIDYMTYGGMYREVYLDVKGKTSIEDIFLMPQVILPEGEKVQKKAGLKGNLKSRIVLHNPQENLSIIQCIRKEGEEEFGFLLKCAFQTKENFVVTEENVENICLWDVENPCLYEVKTQLLKKDEILDEVIHCCGFRKAQFLEDGFYLNGEKLKIRGLNRHQSYPYVGYAMPSSMQKMDADILKNELGLNAVRTSHYPQSQDFLDSCDRLGLLVFTEIPGWQHIGDDEWKKQAVKNTEDMVKQYRNHPSIILWGVRINESSDDDDFYEKTNETARKLDPTRCTGGVRAHKKSSFLEDVYTYNDFSHNGKNAGCEPKKNITPDTKRPYLISEYNGHMFPTKSFDSEEKRTHHAIRHANVLNDVAKREDIAGSFGWCMADYNTHKDFGSGDRICYHGVLDMFRNPKMAAEVYACQQEKEIHLAVTSSMDIGEHNECNREKVWIISNADSVKMYKNGCFIKEYPMKSKEYPYLLHGPVLIDDYIGDAILKTDGMKPAQAKGVKDVLNATALYGLSNLPKRYYITALKMMVFYGMKWEDAVKLYNKYIGDWGGKATEYRFEAVKDGKVVKKVVKKIMTKVCINAIPSHRELTENTTYDVGAVRIRAEDEYGNILPFYQEPLTVETKGPIEVIGPKVFSLKGGMGGTYVKTMGKEGCGKLIIKGAEGTLAEIEFQVTMRKVSKA